MTDEREDELSKAESKALRLLRVGPHPPQGLEDRVISALRERGMLHDGQRASRRRRWVLASVAASMILFAGGAMVGFRLASPSFPPRERFVLFLYEGSEIQKQALENERERIDEYRTWARELRRSGSLLTGEKLKDGEQNLGGGNRAAGPGIVGGYFIIAARDLEQARTIASTCPHLRYGGWIVIRQIDPL